MDLRFPSLIWIFHISLALHINKLSNTITGIPVQQALQLQLHYWVKQVDAMPSYFFQILYKAILQVRSPQDPPVHFRFKKTQNGMSSLCQTKTLNKLLGNTTALRIGKCYFHKYMSPAFFFCKRYLCANSLSSQEEIRFRYV